MIARGAFVALTARGASVPLGALDRRQTEVAVIEFAVRTISNAVSATIDLRVPVAETGEPVVRSYGLPFRAPVTEEVRLSGCRIPLALQMHGNWDRLDLRLTSDERPAHMLEIEIDTWDAGQAAPPLRALLEGTWQVFFYQSLNEAG